MSSTLAGGFFTTEPAGNPLLEQIASIKISPCGPFGREPSEQSNTPKQVSGQRLFVKSAQSTETFWWLAAPRDKDTSCLEVPSWGEGQKKKSEPRKRVGSPFSTAWPQALLFFFSSFSPLAFSVLLTFYFLSFFPLPFLRFPGSAQHSDPGTPGLGCSSQRPPDTLPTALHASTPTRSLRSLVPPSRAGEVRAATRPPRLWVSISARGRGPRQRPWERMCRRRIAFPDWSSRRPQGRGWRGVVVVGAVNSEGVGGQEHNCCGIPVFLHITGFVSVNLSHSSEICA